MTRDEFLQRVARAGWCAYDLNPTWIRVSRYPGYSYPDDGPINPMGPVEIVMTPEGQINLMLPTRFLDMCPGRPGQVRHFRVTAADWDDAWALIGELYREFAAQWEPDYALRKLPFEDLVLLSLPAKRLIPDDYSFYLQHRGSVPTEQTPVQIKDHAQGAGTE